MKNEPIVHLSDPVVKTSDRVRAQAFDEPWLQAIAEELQERVTPHRKLWEFAYIAQVYRDRIGSGGRVLGFGVGREPLASWFAAQGAEVVMTDLQDPDPDEWSDDDQHATGIWSGWREGVCKPEDYERLVHFEYADMRAIPEHLRRAEFDLVWSAGSFEHLGSPRAGLRFVESAMECLAEGGVAVHTTELATGAAAARRGSVITYTASDLAAEVTRLERAGHKALPLNLEPGDSILDRVVDEPPFKLEDECHLTIRIGSVETTSVGIVVLRGEKRPAVTGDHGRLRVLFVGDSPTVSSGFARCTHAACDALDAAGHEVHVLGLNYFGDPHDHPYKIYPCVQPADGGRDYFGVGRLPVLAERIKPDVVVLLNDPWNIPAYLDALDEATLERKPLVIGWLAVDGKNQRGAALDDLDHVVTWTEWAGEELRRGGYGGEYSVVPLGVDHDTFRPMSRAMSRRMVLPQQIPQDAFIVGVVGRNQPRKRLDLTLEYFAEWVRGSGVEDAYLYMHCAPTGERGHDLRSLTVYHGLSGRVIVANPDIQHGEPDSSMPHLYSSFDAYLTTTQGEGWGLPALEAMACGVPVVAPDWSGLGDWAKPAAALVPCTATATTAPLNGSQFTVGGIADKALTVEALDRIYRDYGYREDLSALGLGLATTYSWDRTGGELVGVLESLAGARSEEVA